MKRPFRSGLWPLLFGFGFLCGCVVPLPHVARVASGHRPASIGAKDFFTTGTPKAEIVAELGSPALEAGDGRVIGYAWEIETASHYQTNPGPNNNEVKWKRSSQMLLIAFDDGQHMLAFERVRFETGGPTVKFAMNWLAAVDRGYRPKPVR